MSKGDSIPFPLAGQKICCWKGQTHTAHNVVSGVDVYGVGAVGSVGWGALTHCFCLQRGGARGWQSGFACWYFRFHALGCLLWRRASRPCGGSHASLVIVYPLPLNPRLTSQKKEGLCATGYHTHPYCWRLPDETCMAEVGAVGALIPPPPTPDAIKFGACPNSNNNKTLAFS